jgi:hypothetical protein
LIEIEKKLFSIKKNVAYETEDYSNYKECLARASISEINSLQRELNNHQKDLLKSKI